MKLHVKTGIFNTISVTELQTLTVGFYEKSTTKCCNDKISSQNELFASYFFLSQNFPAFKVQNLPELHLAESRCR